MIPKFLLATYKQLYVEKYLNLNHMEAFILIYKSIQQKTLIV